MELKLINQSIKNDTQHNYDDCYIEVLFNGKKLAKISFLMFYQNKYDDKVNNFMLEHLPLLINGDHHIDEEDFEQKIFSQGDEVTFEYSDSNSTLELILPKSLCIPIFEEMIKLYSS